MVNGKVHTQDIIKGIGAGLCLLDRNFRIVWMNKIFLNWVGIPQEIYGRHCYKIFEHRNRICPGCPTQEVFKTGNIHKAKRTGFTKDGQRHYFQLTVSPIKDSRNRVIFALELAQDITKTIKTQRHNLNILRKLKQMHEHLASLNLRLRSNLQRLKEITKNISGSHSMLEKKYCRERNRLLIMKEELQKIFKINRAISSIADLKKISSLIMRLTCELMHPDISVLSLFDEQEKSWEVNSSYSASDATLKKIFFLRLNKEINDKVAQIKRPLAISDLDKDSRFRLKFKEPIKKEGLRSVLSVPVLFQNRVLGVISVYSHRPQQFKDEEIEVLSVFASNVAIAIQESKYYKDIHTSYFNTMHALVLAIEARDPYTRGHTERVTRYALEVGRALQIPQRELEVLRYAGEVHDLGKISIPDSILNKPGKLSPPERAMIELHPGKGAEMLEPLEFLKPAIPIVRHHHERYDGTGYPDGLDKEKIPIMSRILACADAFDAMTSDRPYRRSKLTIGEALAEIKNNAGSQFDPQIACLFIKTIRTQNPIKIKALH